MSSAVQPSSPTSTTLKHARLLATYPVDMFKAIEPFVPTLERCRNEALKHTTVDHTNPVTINNQILTIYTTLGHTRAAILESLPANMLDMGGEHIFFNSTGQTHQGDWIKGIFDLVRDLENHIRDYFRNPTDPTTLLKEIVTSDTLSVVRLLRERQRFNLLTGEIAAGSASDSSTLYKQDDTVRVASRFALKPIKVA